MYTYSYCNRNIWHIIIALHNISSKGMLFLKNMSALRCCDLAAMLHCNKNLLNGGNICGQDPCGAYGAHSDFHCTF